MGRAAHIVTTGPFMISAAPHHCPRSEKLEPSLQ